MTTHVPTDTPIEEMDTESRRQKLTSIQDRMQTLWTQIEWLQGDFGLPDARSPAIVQRQIKKAWARFEELEVEERKYLIPGFPLTPAARKAYAS
jgi:hypothetical protein